MGLQQLLPALTGHWTRRAVPDLSGRVALITGFNSGIGFEVSRALLEHGAEVIGVCRSSERGADAAADLQEEFPQAAISFKVCNLELMEEVVALSKELEGWDKPISLLINNAGRFVDAPYSVTKEGFEQTMAIDFWGHALLTLLLLPKIMSNGPARIINTVSPAELFGSLDWDDLTGCSTGVKLRTSGIQAYGRAKLMLLIWSFELQRRLRLAGAQVDAFAVHPGVVSTPLMDKVDFRYPFALLTYLMNRLQGQSPLQGAQSTIFAATAPELAVRGGQYLGPQYQTNMFHSTKRLPGNPQAYDVDARVRLWDETLRQLTQVTGHSLPSLPAVGTRV